MPPTPIIVHTSTEKECIIYEGVKYCKDTTVTPHEVGVTLLVLAGFIVGMILLLYVWDRFGLGAALLAILIPLVVIGLYLVLFK